jgi:hypothetical protein
MPGAPWMGRGKPMAERSPVGIALSFIVGPVVLGAAILVGVVVNVVAREGKLTPGEWFWQVAWCGLLGLAAIVALPVVGWRELRRRRENKLPRRGVAR